VKSGAMKLNVKTFAYDSREESHPFDSDTASGVSLNQSSTVGSWGNMPVRTSKGDRLMVDCKDFLTPVTTTTNQAIGDVIYEVSIDPSIFTNTRIALMATTFQKMLLKRLIFE